jgi:hypothetical protein
LNTICQIAYPTTAEEARYWPSQTTFLDGLLGQDLFTNYMLSVRLQVQHCLYLWLLHCLYLWLLGQDLFTNYMLSVRLQVFSYYRMCSPTTECVLLLQNVFTNYMLSVRLQV